MIPKIIHYIWFGDPLKKPVERINNWKKILPDFEFKEWGEKDFDFSKYQFAQRAYDAGKYGIAIDPFRAEILCAQGGVWLDTDVVIHKDLTPFLEYSLFAGYEILAQFSVGVFGIISNSPYMTRVLSWYDEQWSNCGQVSSGALETKYREFASPRVFKHSFIREYGWTPDGKSKTLETKDGPMRFEAPPVFTIRGDYGIENYAEHLYEGSWMTGENISFYQRVVNWQRGFS